MKVDDQKYILGVLLLFAVYFVTAKIGLSFDAVSGFATLVWPPTGIALAALLLYGYRLWPAITLAAFLVNLSVGASPAEALGIAIGNTLEPLAGAYMLNKFVGFNLSLHRVKDVIGLVVFAAAISTMISATIGVTTLLIGGDVTMATYPKTWFTWWVGDALGALVIAPMILVWSKTRIPKLSFEKFREYAAYAAVLIAFSFVVFHFQLESELTLRYLLYPPLIWAALRYGQRVTISSVFAVSLISVAVAILTGMDHPDAHLSNSLLLLQLFMGITAITFMILAAITSEHLKAEALRRKLLQRAIQLNLQKTHLEDVSYNKDELITLASHQLRTPATNIKINLGALLDNLMGELTNDQREFISSAYDSNEQQIAIINELLGIAKIDTGSAALQMKETEMKPFVSRVVKNMTPIIRSREQSIDFVHNDNEHMARIDQNKMAMVLQNIIDNASKYSEAGKEIRVELGTGNSLEIMVKDEGVGIAEEDMEKIFNKFARLDNNGTSGSGLGLHWAKKVVELHQGRIAVKSEPGKGSVFIIHIPSKI